MIKKELKDHCVAAMQDQKFLLAALLLQLGGKVVIDHEFFIQAAFYFNGQCSSKNTPEGIVMTMETTERNPLEKKSPLDDDDFLNKVLESGHAGTS